MGEGVFIYLLKMSAAKKLVNLEAGFADYITKPVDIVSL